IKQTAQSKLAYFYAALMDQFCAALDSAPSPAIDLPLWDHIPPALAARRIVETLKGFQFSCQAVRNCFRRVC
ncbi:hypothetical protein, partial [Phaeobacter gallaeciensis]|uniref:hypothetical protein n=1 Tax=Phaeobacter gallaeciensis TaxID=60890 RepID=UPI00237F00D3